MVPGIGGILGCLRLIKDIKSPCGGRGALRDRLRGGSKNPQN